MSKRAYIRIISFIAFGLSILIIYCSIATSHLDNYKTQLENNYQQSLVELNECLNTIETDLNKCLYSNSTGEIYDLSRDIFSQCSTAKNAISRLPINHMNLEGTYKFLSQAGDYAIYMGDKLESRNKIDQDDQNNICSLLSYAEEFSSSTNDMIGVVESGGKITSNQVISNLNNQDVNALSTSFTNNENSFDDYPTLLYDGPFSDQKINRKPVFLKGKEILTQDKCRRIAANALGTTVENISFSTDQDAAICCYNFKYGRYFIAITQKGGYVKSIMNSGFVDKSVISPESAIEVANAYLNKIGYENMKENYYTINNNICTINFAYNIGETCYYPDLIKISVSLQDGTIIGLDANTYLMNHKQREDISPAKNLEQAKECVSPFLEIVSHKKCVVPMDNGKETKCWEFHCKNPKSGKDALIYINSNNLIEEQIQLLLYSDNGILVK